MIMRRRVPHYVARRLRQLVSIIEDGTSHKADELAVILDTSPRTIYRDISLLRRHGWNIPGEAGVGYIFKGRVFRRPVRCGRRVTMAQLVPAPRDKSKGIQDMSSNNDASHTALEVYVVGDRTMEKVFRPAGLTNVSDLQAVFDAVEKALTEPDLPFRHDDIKRGLILFRTSNNAHGYTNFVSLTAKVDALPQIAKDELADLMRSIASGLSPASEGVK